MKIDILSKHKITRNIRMAWSCDIDVGSILFIFVIDLHGQKSLSPEQLETAFLTFKLLEK